MIAENVQYELKKREQQKHERTLIKMSIDLRRQLGAMSPSTSGEGNVDKKFADILKRAAGAADAPETITIPASSAKDVIGKANVLGTVSAIITSRPSRCRKRTRAQEKPKETRRCISRECKSNKNNHTIPLLLN